MHTNLLYPKKTEEFSVWKIKTKRSKNEIDKQITKSNGSI